MKRLACVLCVVLFFSWISLAQVGFGLTGTMHLPFDVVTPDGLVLPAGDYFVNIPGVELKLVGRPPASMGFWPGPQIRLGLLAGPEKLPATFWLKTVVEVRVVYDIPREWERRQQIRSASPDVAPLIRKRRELVGFVHRGDILYITEAGRSRSVVVFRAPLGPFRR